LLVVFITYIVLDTLYAYYVICLSDGNAFSSALFSSAIYSLGAYGVISFSKNLWYLILLATGAFIGTYINVKLRGYKKPK
jgi:hypothetical protein